MDTLKFEKKELIKPLKINNNKEVEINNWIC